MTTLELASLVMSAEFALASAVILFLVRRRQRRATSAQQVQQAGLEEMVSQELPSRREALTELFSSNVHLQGSELATTVDEFLAREQAFYDAMLNIHLGKDGKSLSDIPGELRKVLAPWAELQDNANQDVAAMGDLRSENADLLAQLDHNKEVIKRLLDEYDASFNKYQGHDEQADPQPAPVAAKPMPQAQPKSKPDPRTEPEPQAASTPEPELLEEASLEDEIQDILSSEPVEAEESIEQSFDEFDALSSNEPDIEPAPDIEPENAPDTVGSVTNETLSSESSPVEHHSDEVIFSEEEDDAEELADLFDSVSDSHKS